METRFHKTQMQTQNNIYNTRAHDESQIENWQCIGSGIMDLHLNNALARCLNALHFITSHLNQEVPLNLEEISNPINPFRRSNAFLLQRLCL